MPSHPLARLAGCFATGALAAAIALIGLDQAALAYDPQPPFDSGSSAKAGPALTDNVLQRRARALAAAREAAGRAAARLKG